MKIVSDSDILSIARRNLEASLASRSVHKTPDAGNRWASYSGWALQNIEQFGSPQDVITFAQTKYGFEVRETGPHLSYAVAAFEWKILAEFPELESHLASFFEPESSHADSVILHKGRRVSTSLYHQIRFHFVISSYISATVDNVCEIGGGYGAPARVWFLSPIRKPKTYIIVDLAESLFFAEVFLRSELPELKVIHLGADALENADVILCPVEMIQYLEVPVDLIVNTLSMAEMPEEWVDFYMKWLDESNAQFFYSFNTFGRPISKLSENANVYSPRPSSNWVARLLRFPYDSDIAEMLFERIPRNNDWDDFHRKVYDTTIERALDRANYLVAVDSLRYTQDRRRARELTDRCFAHLNYIPKELAYFSDLFGDERTRARIAKARQSGQEGLVSTPVRELLEGT